MRQLTTRVKPKRTLTPQPAKQRGRKGRWPGLFVSLEGGEGAGKTSLMHRLRDALLSDGIDVYCTREPGGTSLGEHVRQWVLNPHPEGPVDAKAELCLFLAARAQHIQEAILPALKAGKVVLCDRFNDSTIAYQGVGRGLGIQYVRQLCGLICDGVTPDLSFYLDISPEVGLDRAAKQISRQGPDRIEREELAFHLRIRDAFLQMARNEAPRFRVLDAHQSPIQVFEEAYEMIRLHLSKRQP